MKFLIETLGYDERDLIVAGRSMGTGPACELAAYFSNIAGLLLISPYKSLKAATSSLLGSFVSMLVRERFDNYSEISKVLCPILIIHG
jgi:hypothetical protein